MGERARASGLSPRRRTTPAKARPPSSRSEGRTRKKVESGTKRSNSPATTNPSGTRQRSDRQDGRQHLRAQGLGCSHREHAHQRRVHERREEADGVDDHERDGPRHREAEEEERQGHRDDRDCGQLQQVDAANEPLCRERTDERAAAEGREQEAEHARVGVIAEKRDRLQPDDEPLHEEVQRTGDRS